MRALCVQGLGVAQLTRWDVAQEIAAGLLQEVTWQDATPQSLSVWAVLPSVRFLPQRVTLFIEALKAALAPDGGDQR